jgi:hypothetical protein
MSDLAQQLQAAQERIAQLEDALRESAKATDDALAALDADSAALKVIRVMARQAVAYQPALQEILRLFGDEKAGPLPERACLMRKVAADALEAGKPTNLIRQPQESRNG